MLVCASISFAACVFLAGRKCAAIGDVRGGITANVLGDENEGGDGGSNV